MRGELIELAESIRIDEQVLYHNVHYRTRGQAERLARRYLELLKWAVLDEHYLENELRIEHLLAGVLGGETISDKKLRDPSRYMARELRASQAAPRHRRARTAPVTCRRSPSPTSGGIASTTSSRCSTRSARRSSRATWSSAGPTAAAAASSCAATWTPTR